jgi:hypothetical protein
MKPLRQGDLDGLCGVYAVLNVTQLLVPKARDWDYLEKLFVHIVGGIYHAKDVTAGGEIGKMLAVLDYARDHVHKHFGVYLSVSNNMKGTAPWHTPFHALEATFNAGHPGAYIMGYEGRDSHWTVVRGITIAGAPAVQLFDSCEQKFFYAEDFVWRGKTLPKKSNKIIVQTCDLVWVSVDGAI